MKKLISAIVICLAMQAAPADAMFMVIEPEVTNWSDSSENHPFLGHFPLRYGQSPVEAIEGGWYAWGTAFEFHLEQDWLVKSIQSPIAVSRGIQNGVPVPGTWDLDLALYRGTRNTAFGQPLPEGQVIPGSGPFFVERFTAVGHDLVSISGPSAGPEGERVFTFQGPDNLNLRLEAGTYWAGYFDRSVVSYVQPRVRLEVVGSQAAAVPEPATLALFGPGLLGLALRKKYVGAGA